MPSVFQQLKRDVIDVLRSSLMTRLSKFISFTEKALWGSNRPAKSFQMVLYITIWKDIRGLGYDALRKYIAPFWKMGNVALQHNVKYVRSELRRWANTIIRPEDPVRLERLAARTNRPTPCEKVTLWMDSTDFRIKGKRSLHKSKMHYAKKLQSPGRRWLTICNARGQTQWVSSPHLPTSYDGDLAIRYAMLLQSYFEHSIIVADNHFRKATSHFENITLITPKSKAGRRKKVDGVLVPRELSEEDEIINNVISGIRGKVEAPYAWVKARFSALSQPFYEDADQHDCLVKFAFACHRVLI
jgi:hypothetical protein